MVAGEMAKVEFHFDFGSPNAYLAHQVIPQIEARTGAKFEYVPILLGGVFKLTNNRSPAEKMAGIKNRLEYERLELQRFVQRNGVAFNWNPFFPVNTLLIMRGAVATQLDGDIRALCQRSIPPYVGRAEGHGRSRRNRCGPHAIRFRCRFAARAHSGSGSQGTAFEEYREFRRARRVRIPDIFRRRSRFFSARIGCATLKKKLCAPNSRDPRRQAERRA